LEHGALPGPTLAADKAYAQAGIGPSDLDLAEVHDAVSPAELMHYRELRFCEDGEVAHLAAQLGELLAIQMKLGARMREHRRPVRMNGFIRPDIAKQIDHDDWRVLRGIAQRQTADGAQLLSKLACWTGINRMVTTVVRARCDLVDQDCAFGRDEHFHRHGADVI
jgi:hypothetical protein